MRSLRSSIKMIAACLVLAAIPSLTAAQSTEIPDTFCVSGLIGLSRGQAVSLNFTNNAREVTVAHFYFLDTEGRLLKSSSVRVLPGQSLGLELSYRELRGASPGRAQIRGVVRLTEPPEPDADPLSPDLVRSNLEIYDEATGKTAFGLLLPAIRNARLYFPYTDAGAVRQEQ